MMSCRLNRRKLARGTFSVPNAERPAIYLTVSLELSSFASIVVTVYTCTHVVFAVVQLVPSFTLC